MELSLMMIPEYLPEYPPLLPTMEEFPPADYAQLGFQDQEDFPEVLSFGQFSGQGFPEVSPFGAFFTDEMPCQQQEQPLFSEEELALSCPQQGPPQRACLSGAATVPAIGAIPPHCLMRMFNIVGYRMIPAGRLMMLRQVCKKWQNEWPELVSNLGTITLTPTRLAEHHSESLPGEQYTEQMGQYVQRANFLYNLPSTVQFDIDFGPKPEDGSTECRSYFERQDILAHIMSHEVSPEKPSIGHRVRSFTIRPPLDPQQDDHLGWLLRCMAKNIVELTIYGPSPYTTSPPSRTTTNKLYVPHTFPRLEKWYMENMWINPLPPDAAKTKKKKDEYTHSRLPALKSLIFKGVCVERESLDNFVDPKQTEDNPLDELEISIGNIGHMDWRNMQPLPLATHSSVYGEPDGIYLDFLQYFHRIGVDGTEYESEDEP